MENLTMISYISSLNMHAYEPQVRLSSVYSVCLCNFTYTLHTQEHMMLYIDPNVPSALLISSCICPIEQKFQQRMMKKE